MTEAVETVEAPVKTRKPRSKNRPKDEITAEKAERARNVAARKACGLGTRGRLSDDQKAELAKYLDEHKG